MSPAEAPVAEPPVEASPPATEAVVPERVEFEAPPTNWWGKLMRWAERKFSLWSTKDNLGHRICSWIFLPLAYRSGIKFRGRAGYADTSITGDDTTEHFECVLPFSRFNKNWYNAMAGAALLANSEVAGGMYIFKSCGGDYTVVCKELHYTFRRPCVGPAVYRVEPREDLEPLVAHGDEFNITVDMTIFQAVVKKGEKQKKSGTCVATFHVAPKAKFWQRQQKLKERQRDAAKLN
ncbi:MAG: hypothetical protein AAF328_09490 [Planctomycetota bacterium]